MSGVLKRSVALAATLWCAFASAGPVIIEERVKLVPPDPLYPDVNDVAVDGDRAVVSASRRSVDTGEIRIAAYVFELNASSGTWVHAATLVNNIQSSPFYEPFTAVAIHGNVAAVSWFNQVRIFERTSSGWVNTASFQPPPGIDHIGGDVEVNNGSVLVSGAQGLRLLGVAYRKNSSGQWVQIGVLGAGPTDGSIGEDVDIVGNLAALTTPFFIETASPGTVHLYRLAGGWTNIAVVPVIPAVDPVDYARAIATDGSNLIVSDGLRQGSVLFREASGDWLQMGRLVEPNSMLLQRSSPGPRKNSIATDSGLAAIGVFGEDSRMTLSGAVYVYDLVSSGDRRSVAKLLASDAREQDLLGESLDMSGRRVIARSARAAYIFDLPNSFTAFPVHNDDFELGNAADWTPEAGGQFAVMAGANGSHVYRQSSLAGNARSIRQASNWRNESIQADIKPTAFDGSDRWFGLFVRYSDARNFYYVTVRSSNVIQIRRLHNNAVTTLASATMPVGLNRSYRVRLEAVGRWLRVFVDGVLVLQAQDTTHNQGHVGVLMYKTRADYDNVVISANPQLALFEDDFDTEQFSYRGWEPVIGGSWITVTDGSTVYQQSSTAGDARSIVNAINTDDQIVQVRAKATAFAGSDRWFGVAARYADDNNYYYLTVRNSNQVSLRRLVGGSISVLDTAPMTVAADTWYTLRLEVVGNKLRGYVNGQLLVETTDSTIPVGKYGVVMYKTAARFDDFLAIQP